MSPGMSSEAMLLASTEINGKTTKLLNNSKNYTEKSYQWDICWRNVIGFIYLHIGAVYAVYLISRSQANAFLFFYFLTCGQLGGLGITAGAHRLWAHKTYKAKWPLRLFLGICQTIAFQNHIYEWVRDHRVHHKFTDTDADPHNVNRGFFFSHMGWLMVRKHPDVKDKGKSIDMSDLDDDFVVVWQRRLFYVVGPLFAFILPPFIPSYFFGYNPWLCHYLNLFRYTLSLHFTWFVNSAAHIWGNKPYDATISPTENLFVGIVANGEGWHNYHHVFPWDYKAAELGNYKVNMTTLFIDICAKLNLAYSLKTASNDMIVKRSARTGDGSHDNEENVWGWDDPDMKECDKQETKQFYYKEE